MYDFAVVGSGVGGSSIAALLTKKGFKVALFEKDANLGGCSSSFRRKWFLYNAGATTLAGYEQNHPVKEIFDRIGIEPNLKECSIGMEVIQNSKRTKRFKDLPKFIAEINENYPHKKQYDFWQLVYKISKDFYALQGYYYTSKNIFAKYRSLLSFIPFVWKFKKYLFIDAQKFITKFYGGLDDEYKDFLEAQVLIVAQAKLKDVSFFTAAIALAYTFHKNYYVVGGFEKLFDLLTKDIDTVLKKTEVRSIQKVNKYFALNTKHKTFYAKKVILNSTVYKNAALFEEQKLCKEFTKYEKLDNHQGTFVVYMALQTNKTFQKHYQLIKEKNFTYAISKSVFVSFGDDLNEGYISVTASTHTDYRIWYDNYKQKKEALQEEIVNEIMKTFHLEDEDIIELFSATPQTFKRYINREQAGGNAITMKNFITRLPANDTHIKGLYQVGDTTFAAQGWPGVMMGVKNLARLLNV